MYLLRGATVILLLGFAGHACAQAGKPTISMERFEGSSIRTELSRDIVLNKGSTLKREWFVVRDSSAPVAIEGSSGVSVVYKSDGRYSGGYEYRASYQLKAQEPVTAVEVRFVVLNVFGGLLKTLTATEVVDFNAAKELSGSWRIFSENEASEAFASIAYVAQVRTASGKVYEANRSAVFEQVRKVARRITEADLEPKREAPAPTKS
jgi:hypothetical protein